MSDSSGTLNLILIDFEPELCAAWREAFADLPRATVAEGRFEDLPEYDCLITAGNSFGLMDGGVDLAVARRFPHVPPRVAARVRDDYLGEQPVGTSFLVETGEDAHPYVAHTPTMRVPMRVGRTDHAYVALWASLGAIHRHNRATDSTHVIRTLACPGLCTATGRMHPAEAARQMALAWLFFVHPPACFDWRTATERQDRLGRGGDFAILPIKPQET